MLHVSAELDMIFFDTFGFSIHFNIFRKINIVLLLLFIPGEPCKDYSDLLESHCIEYN